MPRSPAALPLLLLFSCVGCVWHRTKPVSTRHIPVLKIAPTALEPQPVMLGVREESDREVAAHQAAPDSTIHIYGAAPIQGAYRSARRLNRTHVHIAAGHSLSDGETIDPEAAWFNQLSKGLLKDYVPAIMQWKVPSTVTVVVTGEGADASAALANATGTATIKVARQMRVMVSCPDAPDEFVIAAEPGTKETQFVPEQGVTTWNYSVTPRYTGKQQKIAIRAWVLYPGAKEEQHELPVYTATVNVQVPTPGECLKRLLEGDPDYWLKYGLPGGAGFAFLSGALTSIWKWKRKGRAPTHKPPVPV